MENFKKLSREEMKNTLGGKACKLVMPDGHGGFKTFIGTCGEAVVSTTSWGIGVSNYTTRSFCDIGNGVAYPLTSNGGNSTC